MLFLDIYFSYIEEIILKNNTGTNSLKGKPCLLHGYRITGELNQEFLLQIYLSFGAGSKTAYSYTFPFINVIMTPCAQFQSTSKCANKIVWFIKFIHKDKKIVRTRIFY